METSRMQLQPIGIIHSPFRQTDGMPIQPVFAKGREGTIEVFPEFAEALTDIEGFERIWLLYWFDRALGFKPKVKPYLNGNMHGLFATRAPARPNPIGISCVTLLSVKADTLHVAGMDILDSTPLLDIKPYVKWFDSFDVKRNGWLDAIERRCAESGGRFRSDQGK